MEILESPDNNEELNILNGENHENSENSEPLEPVTEKKYKYAFPSYGGVFSEAAIRHKYKKLNNMNNSSEDPASEI